MALNLIGESAGKLDWIKLQVACSSYERVCFFPIPGGSEPDALGIYVPSPRRSRETREELAAVISRLRDEFSLSVVELSSGRTLQPEQLTAAFGPDLDE